MNLFSRKPWLYLSPQLAHDLSPVGLNLWARFLPPRNYSWQSFQWRGLHFRNRLGIAGGVDKTGNSLLAWNKFGCGFLEVGTVTPLPQAPNPGPILDRDLLTMALWNKMGFPGPGAEHVAEKLKSLGHRLPRPLFVNIGKNRTTPNENAAADYVRCFEKLYPFADAFVVNISSPNTSGLRALSQHQFLDHLLGELAAAQFRAQTRLPILLKLSPDMSETELAEVLESSLQKNIDGWILTNTTLARAPDSKFSSEGGVSGAPLNATSKLRLQQAIQILGARKQEKLLVSVGGVMTAEDVAERLRMGADLVQVYSTLAFKGPQFFGQTAKYFDKNTSDH